MSSGRSLPVMSPRILQVKYGAHDWSGRMQMGGQMQRKRVVKLGAISQPHDGGFQGELVFIDLEQQGRESV